MFEMAPGRKLPGAFLLVRVALSQVGFRHLTEIPTIAFWDLLNGHLTMEYWPTLPIVSGRDARAARPLKRAIA
jgi:hypothetical protein